MGKRDALEKDSALGYNISLEKINLSQLISKKYFTILYILSRNKYRINTSILVNTGVNGFAFINTSFTIETTRFLNIKAIRLP